MEIIKIYPKNNKDEVIQKIVSALEKNAVIIYPTDTMYAVGCSIKSVSGVNRICELKNVKVNKNRFAFICPDLSNISQYAKVSNFAFKTLKHYLPGPYTFILPASSEVPNILIQGKKTVGVRIPAYDPILEIVEKLGVPLITTTLPFDGVEIEYFTNPELITERYGHQIDILLDGGIGGFQPSSVIEILDEDFEVIREGVGDCSGFY
ncbi:threonylcarbamoyl-AMP synthase [Sandaracinomonas limnophila]|uniref:Threonylcarbamoyl-AMP synthase n=1 Tax=Sandaracinomonas limnophila TaxID=1862386 RepID=A0A437PWZ3_9BACT|nr:L-threonylcarbamoyladenylate synthase [Sandaracinomonas limnophila]RVU26787.1 threonylcarbamoyl-AMP synthase [Sandaracinomonas limnophila]